MAPEYSFFSDGSMSRLIKNINNLTCKGWRLVNIFHDNYEYIAVLKRKNIEKKEIKNEKSKN